MKICLSGANGFVGSKIRSLLESQGVEVIGIGRNQPINWNNLSQKELEVDVYIHTSGKAHDVEGKSELQDYMDINLGLTKLLFEKFILDGKAKSFIYFSSVKAAASEVEGVLHETDRFHIRDSYGLSKRAAEDYLLNYQLPNNKKLFILRPCMIYGDGHKGNLNLLKQLVMWNIPYPLAAFENQRSFVSIETVIQVISKLLENNNLPVGIYNIADSGYLSANDWIIKLSKELGKKPKLWRISPKIIRGIAYLGDHLKLPLNTHRLKKLTENYRVSNARMLEILESKSSSDNHSTCDSFVR